MNDVKLGKLIEGADARRDAVHVALAPVVAAEVLRPGDHVGRMPDGRYGENAEVRVGIVDPFLDRNVLPDQQFYLCLYPNTVTGLRHEWAHPAFPDPETSLPTREQATAGEAGPAGSKRLSDLQYSEAWLRWYAEKLNCYEGPEEAYRHLLEGLKSGELYARGSDLHGLYELEDAEELRQHAELVLGKCIDWNTFTFSAIRN